MSVMPAAPATMRSTARRWSPPATGVSGRRSATARPSRPPSTCRSTSGFDLIEPGPCGPEQVCETGERRRHIGDVVDLHVAVRELAGDGERHGDPMVAMAVDATALQAATV